MADQVVVTDAEAVRTIEKFAEQKSISKAEAAARLVATAKGRINAVRKYAAAHAAPKADSDKPRRGRPPGSKNKPKPEAKVEAAPPVRRKRQPKVEVVRPEPTKAEQLPEVKVV